MDVKEYCLNSEKLEKIIAKSSQDNLLDLLKTFDLSCFGSKEEASSTLFAVRGLAKNIKRMEELFFWLTD